MCSSGVVDFVIQLRFYNAKNMESLKESGNKQVFTIKPHRIISQMIVLLTFLGLWEKDNQHFLIKLLKKFAYVLICCTLFGALLWGAYLCDNKNESFFLTACATAVFLQISKLISVLTKKDQILSFLDDICVHSLSDLNESDEVQLNVNNFAKFGYIYLSITAISVVGFHIVTLPIFSPEGEVTLPVSIGFPLDWKNDRVNYWLAHSFIAMGIVTVMIVYFFTMIYWYVMFSCSIKYKILGNQFKRMGQRMTTINGQKDSVSMDNQTSFSQCPVELIKIHRNLHKYFRLLLDINIYG